MEDKLTVIVPVYNREDKLKETIISIENQNCKDFEILIIDDGSTDDSKIVIESLMKDYNNIKYIYKENGGVSSARNLGIKNVKTKYFSFLDSDDFYKTNFVEKMLNAIRENNADIAACGYEKIKNGKRSKVRNLFIKEDILLNYILGKNNFCTCTFVFNTNFINKNNIFFDEDLSYGEDITYFIESLSKTNKVVIVKDYLSIIINNDQLSSLSKYRLEDIHKDSLYVKKLLNNSDIVLNDQQKDALVGYRYVGHLVYRLLRAFSRNYSSDEIKSLYNQYKDDIEKISLKYGIRSLKLLINKKRLEKKLK